LCNGFEQLTVIVGTDPMLQFVHMPLPIRFGHGPLAMPQRQRSQAITPLCVRASCGSGRVLQCCARCQLVFSRWRARRIVSSLIRRSVTPCRDNVYREALPAAYELQLGYGKAAIGRNFNRHDAPVAMRASLWHLEHIHAKVSVGGGIWRHRQDRGFQPVLPVV
jgi:hypothetical protein